MTTEVGGASIVRPARRWNRPISLATVFVVVVGVVALFGWGLQRDPTQIRTVLAGKPAPPFDLPKLDGPGSLSQSDLEGQVVVVNFWASWCTACRLEHPNFLAAWDRYRDRGVVFIGVLYQDSPDKAMAYMRELGGDWPQVVDPGGRMAQAYGVYGVPETFFIGREGVVAYKRVGYSSYDLLTQQIERLLPGGGS